MRPKLVIGLVAGMLLIIILFQNTQATILRLYFWNISVPLIILILVVLVIGLAGGFVIAKLMGRKKSRKMPGVKSAL